MVVTDDFADDLGALDVLLAVNPAAILHGVEDAAVDGLEAVARIRQRATNNDAHRVVNVGPLHLLFDVDEVQSLVFRIHFMLLIVRKSEIRNPNLETNSNLEN
jgi:hypothetical protein